MTGFLSIPGFEKWQHYKDRTPPWIKLHRDLLRDYDFIQLPDAIKAHLILIWLLASQMDNQIPNDPAFIQRMTGAATKPDINLLIRLKFLLLDAPCQQNASDPPATRPTLSNVRETETEEETEGELDTQAREAHEVSLSNLSVHHVSEWLSKQRAAGKYLHHDEHFILDYFKSYCQSKGKKYVNYIAAYRNAFTWESCQPKAGNGKLNKDERAKAAVVAGVQGFRDSLEAGH